MSKKREKLGEWRKHNGGRCPVHTDQICEEPAGTAYSKTGYIRFRAGDVEWDWDKTRAVRLNIQSYRLVGEDLREQESDNSREGPEPTRLPSRREAGRVVRRERVSDATREALLHRSGDGTTGPEAVRDVSGAGVSKTRFQQFRWWLGSPQGALWYFGTAYAGLVAFWAWRLL